MTRRAPEQALSCTTRKLCSRTSLIRIRKTSNCQNGLQPSSRSAELRPARYSLRYVRMGQGITLMGENHFTYANNSLRVQPRTQIYLVAMIASPGDRTLSLLQTGSLGLQVRHSAAHNQLKSLKRIHLHRIRKFSKLLHGDCEASGGRS